MIQIDCQDGFSETVAFPADGKHFVGGVGGKIRRWRVEDGKEVGTPMEAGQSIIGIAVSRDGKWIVSGTISDGVTVWDAVSHEKVPVKLQTDVGMVFAIDVSPDGTNVATGSGDATACIWSLATGEQVLGPLRHDNVVVGVKFSPDGRFIATAMEHHANSVRIYDSLNGRLVVHFPITISDSSFNESLAWASDNGRLFALSSDGSISCLDVSTGTTLSQWPIHGYAPTSIALASNGTFVAVAAGTSVSFWDTATNERIGSVVEQTAPITSMAISINGDIVTTTGFTITLSGLGGILPSSYHDLGVASTFVSLCKDSLTTDCLRWSVMGTSRP